MGGQQGAMRHRQTQLTAFVRQIKENNWLNSKKTHKNRYNLKMQLRKFFRAELGVEIDICREKYIKPRVREMILKEAVHA